MKSCLTAAEPIRIPLVPAGGIPASARTATGIVADGERDRRREPHHCLLADAERGALGGSGSTSGLGPPRRGFLVQLPQLETISGLKGGTLRTPSQE